MTDFTPPTVQDFLDRYSDFQDVPQARIEAVLAETALIVSDQWRETHRAAGMIALAAHMLSPELSGDAGQSGGRIVSSVSVGDTSVSFQSGGESSDVDLSSTKYGQDYLRLKRAALPNFIRLMRA